MPTIVADPIAQIKSELLDRFTASIDAFLAPVDAQTSAAEVEAMIPDASMMIPDATMMIFKLDAMLAVLQPTQLEQALVPAVEAHPREELLRSRRLAVLASA